MPTTRLEVGRVVRAHGLRGEVVVYPVSNRAERFAVGARLWGADRQFEIIASRSHQDRWIVHFAGVHDRSGAEALRGTVLEGEPLPAIGDDEFWVHELVGAEVVDSDGTPQGRVIAIEQNPAHDILVLDTGALVPLPFVVEPGTERVVVHAPPGLFDADLVGSNRAAIERRKPLRKGGGRRGPETRDA